MSNQRPKFGPTVLRGGMPDALLRTTSVSAIQSFDAEGTEGGCPRKFYYEKVLGKYPPSKVSQEIGSEVHAQLDHYLTSSENILGPIALRGMMYLPAPGPDLCIEQSLAPEESTRKAIALRETGGSPSEIRRLAGLDAAGVPLIGYIDVWHNRGEYVGSDGEIRAESLRVAEAIDHKTSSDPQRWGKSADELPKTVQMTGYGEFLRRRLPLDAVRMSHINYSTKKNFASKVTVLVPVTEIERSWGRVENVVREMEKVIRLPRVEDVPANTNACSSFGGCGHAAYCTRPERTVAQLLGIKKKGASMDSFGNNGSNGAAIPAIPSMVTAISSMPVPSIQIPALTEEARYAAEVARLTAQDAAIGAILPPDAPSPHPVLSADPLPPEVIARAPEPLRSLAQEHLNATLALAAASPAPAASIKPGKHRCAGGKQRVAVAPVNVKTKQAICPACNTEQKIKNFSDDCTTAEISGHMFEVVAQATSASSAPPLPSSASSAPPLPSSASSAPPLPSSASSASSAPPLPSSASSASSAPPLPSSASSASSAPSLPASAPPLSSSAPPLPASASSAPPLPQVTSGASALDRAEMLAAAEEAITEDDVLEYLYRANKVLTAFGHGYTIEHIIAVAKMIRNEDR